MKIVGFVVAMALSASAFAQSCYVLSTLDASLAETVSDSIPAEICVDQVAIDLRSSTIEVVSSKSPSAVQGLKLTSLVRQTEDQYSFESSGVVSEFDYGTRQEKITLKVSGRTDFLGQGDASALSVSVDAFINSDPFHSEGYTYPMVYELRK